jgi:hypothetical protein
LVEQGP